MKKFIDILEEIKQTSGAIAAVENDMMKASEEKKDLQITIKILKNNAKIALFNEVIPVALEVLAKYSGKPYGEKTKQKISDEVKAATSCRFYISSCYSSNSFEVYPVDGFGNDYNISCGTEYTDGSRKPLLIDNKIQLVTFDEVELYYIAREYVADIPQRVEAIKAAHAEAVARQEELNAACSRFNALAVGDIEHLYYNKHIYTTMTI